MQNFAYEYWLGGVKGIGIKTIQKLLGQFGTAKQVFEAEEEELGYILGETQLAQLKLHKKSSFYEDYMNLQNQGIQVVFWGESNYPKRLLTIPDAPYALFCMGALPEDVLPAVAIIGARECSSYGAFVASELGKYLGERGLQVISGMARGIDSISQGAALKAGGSSFGVLGCGVDVCYPKSSQALYQKLKQSGGVISTYYPGVQPIASNFPPRNRVVSGLSDAIVVVEAREKSGTLITVDMALEQGKEVFVVPGRVNDRLSDGCNRLLKQGAGVFLTPAEFVAEIFAITQKQSGRRERPVASADKSAQGNYLQLSMMPELSPRLERVFRALELTPLSVSALLERLAGEETYHSLCTVLMQLCMKGVAIQLSPEQFARSEEFFGKNVH